MTDQPLNEVPAESADPSAEADNSLPEEEPTPSENYTSNKIIVSIHSILPLPQNKGKQTANQKRKRPSQKSEIITSSPFKKLLEEKEREKRN